MCNYSKKIKNIVNQQIKLYLGLEEVSRHLETLLNLTPTDLEYMFYYGLQIDTDCGYITCEKVATIGDETTLMLYYTDNSGDSSYSIYKGNGARLHYYESFIYQRLYDVLHLNEYEITE